MPRHFFFVTLASLTFFGAETTSAADWLQWRGPTSDNHAAPDADPPVQWDLSRSQDVLWNTPIQGAGHSSPTVVGQSIFLTTADLERDEQLLLEFDRTSGELTQSIVVHDKGLPARIHPRNSYASPTVASDGEQIYVVFHNSDAIYVTVYDLSLRKQWQKKVANFKPQAFQFGYGASPILFKDRLIIAAEYDGPDSGIYAFQKKTGQGLWKIDRPANLSFSSPIVAMIAGKDQLLISGADKIESYNPINGKLFWSADSSTEATCGTIVWDDRMVFASGGNPKSGTWAVSADGSGKQIWENRVMSYEQSMLADNGSLYAVSDAGVGYCWRTKDGKEQWKTRLTGGFTSSPMLADGRIYAASEDGEVFVFKATPNRFELLSKNQMGDEIFASPVAVDNQLFIRYAVINDKGRQEYLAAMENQ